MKATAKPLVLLAALAGMVTSTAFAATVNVSGKISQNTTWTSNNTYVLDGYVFVTPGNALTIQSGTIVKAKESSGTGAAALVISRGAKIYANGTAENPIVFTSELDNLNGNLTEHDTALWGGVVILGNASINSRADGNPAGTPAQDQVEGFSVTGDDVALITFGGTDDADNSGVFRYVSIRHGGAVIGTANEINGLTLGGVGSGTTIEYVEVFGNKDDGFEFFGGTVSPRYLVAAFGNDDGFDFDQGYRGTLQFGFVIHTFVDGEGGDKGIEWDGATSPLTATPKGKVTVSNLTIIGAGAAASASSYALNIRDAVEASAYNSVFINFPKMVDFENDVDDGPNPAPVLKGNVFFSHIPANNTAAGLNARVDGTVDATAILSDATNAIADPTLRKVGYTADGALDPRPATGSVALTGAATLPTGTDLVQTAYRGAFYTTNWAAGWTKLSQDGYFSSGSVPGYSRIVNISARVVLGANGSETVIPGFVITGNEPKTVLIQAVGPGLVPLGVTNAATDPMFTLHNSAGTKIGESDDWTGNEEIRARIGATSLPAGSKDAALLITLAPGAYTAVTSAKTAGGDVLVEVYEVD